MVKKIIPLTLTIGLSFSQVAEEKDSTFVLLKTGELKQIYNKQIYVEFVAPLIMNFEITDTDSVKYNIYEIESIQNNKGITIIGEETIFFFKFAKSIFQMLVLFGLTWVIIN